MIVVAQRVESTGPPPHRRGINTYLYTHGAVLWPADPGVMLNTPVVLKDTHVTVHRGGNRIRSYLDVVAPDPTQLSDVLRNASMFISEPPLAGPIYFDGEHVAFRFETDAPAVRVREFWSLLAQMIQVGHLG